MNEWCSIYYPGDILQRPDIIIVVFNYDLRNYNLCAEIPDNYLKMYCPKNMLITWIEIKSYNNDISQNFKHAMLMLFGKIFNYFLN